MRYKKMAVLFGVYGIAGALICLVWSHTDALRPFWFSAVGIGILFFSLEQRTGLSLLEKALPLELLLTIATWVQAVRYQTHWSLLTALFITAMFLLNCRKAPAD